MSSVSTEVIPPAPRITVDHAGGGALVVLLHGVGGNRTFWQEQIQAFAPHFHTVAWDARGYGESDDFDGPLELSDVSSDLLRVLNHFGAGTAHIVGLSIGALFAMDFYRLYPDRVSTLTLCDTGQSTDITPEALAEFLRQRKQPLLEGKMPRDIAPDVARSLMCRFSTERVYKTLHDGYAALRKATLLRMIDAGMNVTRLDFAGVRVPTNVVVGELDPTSPPKVARNIADQIPGAVLSIIPEAGHISNIDQPLAFNEAVLAFLLRHRDA